MPNQEHPTAKENPLPLASSGEKIQHEAEATDIKSTKHETIDNVKWKEEASIRTVSVSPELVMMQQLSQQMVELQMDFATKMKYDQSKQQMIDQLHQELQQYKQEMVWKLLQPILNDLVLLYDEFEKSNNYFRQLPEHNRNFDDVVRHCLSFQKDIEAVLYRAGYEPYTHNEEQFDPRFQNAIKSVVSESSEKNVVSRNV